MKSIEINTTYQVTYEEQGPIESENIVLLLHGYAQSGKEILDLLSNSFPEDYHVIAPNGLYPFYKTSKKSGRPEMKYSWYVFDPINNKYVIDYKHTVNAIHNFLIDTSFIKKNIIVVGYSQGGYLSLLLCEKIKELKKTIGLGCKYRTDLLNNTPLHTNFTSLHGEMDTIVDYKEAKQSFENLLNLGIEGKFITLKNTGHRINEIFQKELLLLFQSLS